MTHKLIKTDNYLFVVDNSDPNKGDYTYNIDNGLISISDKILSLSEMLSRKKIKKVLAHLPLNGSPILEGVDLLPALEDDFDKKSVDFVREIGGTEQQRLAFKDGYLEAKEKYNDKLKEVMLQFDLEIKKHLLMYSIEHSVHGKMCDGINEIRSNILQSLHQYPTEFECEMELKSKQTEGLSETEYYEIPKTTTTNGRRTWVGKYK